MEDFTEIKAFGSLKIDNTKALKKWGPILDALKIEGAELRLFAAVYAEYHQLIDNMNYATIGLSTPLYNSTWGEDKGMSGSGDQIQNLLPVSLKILSKLNLSGKTYEIKDPKEFNIGTLEFSMELSDEEIQDIKYATGMDIVQKLEKKLVDVIVSHINKELETKNNLYIHTLANSINIISAEGFKPRVYITSRYKII